MSVIIDHIAIAVESIEDSLPYYTTELGLSVIHDETLESAGARLVYLAADNLMIQLVQPIADTPVRRFLNDRGEGLHHICLGVRDLPELLGQLPGEADTPVVMGGRSRRACFLAARPNRVAIEVTELEPVSHEQGGRKA